jgi:hypothetical protein
MGFRAVRASLTIAAVVTAAITHVPSAAAYEGSRTHEIFAGSSFRVFSTGDLSRNALLANVSYGYSGLDIQLRAGLGLEVTSGYQQITWVISPTFNFPRIEIENAYFISPFFGFSTTRIEGSTSFSSVYYLEAGKRFEIRDGIMWSPSFTIEGRLNNPNLLLSLLRFSFFL